MLKMFWLDTYLDPEHSRNILCHTNWHKTLCRECCSLANSMVCFGAKWKVIMETASVDGRGPLIPCINQIANYKVHLLRFKDAPGENTNKDRLQWLMRLSLGCVQDRWPQVWVMLAAKLMNIFHGCRSKLFTNGCVNDCITHWQFHFPFYTDSLLSPNVPASHS